MRGRKSFLLRIDPALWVDLEAWAQQELRSVNGQIEFLLRQAVQKRKGTGAVEASKAAAPAAPAAPATPGESVQSVQSVESVEVEPPSTDDFDVGEHD